MKVNLLTFPFAGGSVYSYAQCLNFSSDTINVIPFEYPGRGGRSREPFLTDVHELLDDLFPKVLKHINEPYCFYGHSMGTLVTYLLTKKIITAQLPPPAKLFLTGRGGPSQMLKEPFNYLLPKPALLDKLRSMGGCPEEVLNDDGLMNFFEPIIRADFQVLETYQYRETEPFDIPLIIMLGKDEHVPHDEAMLWQKETTVPIEVIEFPGRHFFIFDQYNDIKQIISERLRSGELITKI